VNLDDRKHMEARYLLFDQFALKDQKNYYENTMSNYRQAAAQVNRYRAWFALFTGVSAAAAGVIVQTSSDQPWAQTAGMIFIVLAVVLPALGAAFSTLADLYQWDKHIGIYDSALENLEVADSLSPVESIPDDETYRVALRAYAEGTLAVMSDETAQWGQSIRTPRQLAQFVEEERRRVARRLDLDLDDDVGKSDGPISPDDAPES
jgi:hypothetical protein